MLFKILWKRPQITGLQLNNNSIYSYSQHYMAVNGQLHAMVILPPMKEASSILWLRGCVVHRPSLDAFEKKITSCHCTTIHWSYITEPGPWINHKILSQESLQQQNMSVSLTYSETTFVFPNKNILYFLSPWQNQLPSFNNTSMMLQ